MKFDRSAPIIAPGTTLRVRRGPHGKRELAKEMLQRAENVPAIGQIFLIT